LCVTTSWKVKDKIKEKKSHGEYPLIERKEKNDLLCLVNLAQKGKN